MRKETMKTMMMIIQMKVISLEFSGAENAWKQNLHLNKFKSQLNSLNNLFQVKRKNKSSSRWRQK
jgi:hypothetical protein